jgi:hypothetical protein
VQQEDVMGAQPLVGKSRPVRCHQGRQELTSDLTRRATRKRQLARALPLLHQIAQRSRSTQLSHQVRESVLIDSRLK